MNKGASKEEEEPPAPLRPVRGFAPGGWCSFHEVDGNYMSQE